jgi:hypothetical protein
MDRGAIMIATCELCDRQNVPCSSCEESQRMICYRCQGDIDDPYCEVDRLGNSIVMDAYAAFGRWLREHDPEGEMPIWDATQAYSDWCDKGGRS